MDSKLESMPGDLQQIDPTYFECPPRVHSIHWARVCRRRTPHNGSLCGKCNQRGATIKPNGRYWTANPCFSGGLAPLLREPSAVLATLSDHELQAAYDDVLEQFALELLIGAGWKIPSTTGPSSTKIIAILKPKQSSSSNNDE